jgi:hypothetical protein
VISVAWVSPADIPEIMTAPHAPTSPDATKRKADLNAAHVAAAALAAVTTAVLGSELGAAGTLIGAAGASVVTTVGTAVYQTSLERSRKRVRSLAQRARPSSASLQGSEQQGSEAEPSRRAKQLAALRWGAVIVGSLGAFLLAMTLITGFEWVNGQTVGGNGKGTTIGQVINDQPAAGKPAAPPSPDAPGASETPTGTPTETPTETPTPTPQAPGILPGIIDSPSTTAPDQPTPTATSDSPSPTTPNPGLLPPVLRGNGG